MSFFIFQISMFWSVSSGLGADIVYDSIKKYNDKRDVYIKGRLVVYVIKKGGGQSMKKVRS
jgi:hypothetical protein